MTKTDKPTTAQRFAMEKASLREEIKQQENLLLHDVEKLPAMLITSAINSGKSKFKGNVFQTAGQLFNTVRHASPGTMPSVLKDTAKQVAIMAAIRLVSTIFKRKLL